MDTLLNHYGLNQIAPAIRRYTRLAKGFYLTTDRAGHSKFGGSPLLPTDFAWPYYTPMRFELPGADPRPLKAGEPRALDFLLQIDLADLHDSAPSPLPASGLLSFFYDVENQPWGYDPAHLDGFKVLFFEDDRLAEHLPPGSRLAERGIEFFESVTLPHIGSRAYDSLAAEADLPDAYFDFVNSVERERYPQGSGLHRLLGHSANVQGDMQLEAQLVSHGLYCGDSSGYQDPKAASLEAGASDWILLLQLDSDDGVDLMWGDAGMLYFWIRNEDLIHKRFDHVWMTLQCG